MTDTTPAPTGRDLALAMVCLAYAEKKVSAAQKRLREHGKGQLVPKENVAAVSPIDGTVLGNITRTNPAKTAKVVDQAALMAHIHDTDPGGLEDVTTVAGNTEQVLDVLRAHAPHLLDSEVRVRDYALNAALRTAEQGKTVPGVEVSTPMGTVNTYPSKDAHAAIEQVIRSGRVTLDGAVLPAITQGDT
jgi:hypothetical protein